MTNLERLRAARETAEAGEPELNVPAPIEREENGKEQIEEAAVITITKGQLESALQTIVADYSQKMVQADNKIEQLKLTLEMQERKDGVKNPIRSRIKVTAVDHGPPDHQSSLVKLYQKQLKGKYYRFANNRPDIRSLRRAQGYEPILDDKGHEVRYIDGVLMAMPRERHKDTIVQPREEKKKFRRGEIARRFHDEGQKQRIETFGDITYDEGDK